MHRCAILYMPRGKGDKKMTYQEAKEKVIKFELVDEAYYFISTLDFDEDKKLDLLEFFMYEKWGN